MAKVSTAESARDRILLTAADLFYKQGYKSTGINEVIEKSGVAKATFYSHFPSKNDLCLAYLKRVNFDEGNDISDYVKQKTKPRSKFVAAMEALEPWIISNQFRGCAFLNMVAEEPDTRSPLRKEGKRHYENIRKLIKTTTQELIESDRKKYKHLDVTRVTDEYMLIFTGAIALCEIYHDIWPVKRGIKAVEKLIS